MSHHSNAFDPEMDRQAKEFMKKAFQQAPEKPFLSFEDPLNGLGPTGNFPDGHLTKHDEGEIQFAVFRKDGKVVMNFNSPVHWLGMTPEQAGDLGRLLIKHSKKAKR